MVEGKLQVRKQNGLETIIEVEEVKSLDDTIVIFCYGCKQVLEEVDYERPTIVLVGIQVGEQDE